MCLLTAVSALARPAVKATVPLGFNPQYLGQLIGFLMSGQGLDAIPGINGQIIGAASAAMKATQAHGYKITWFAFLPGAACFENPKDRINWIVDAPLKTEEVKAQATTADGDSAHDDKAADLA